MMDLEKKIVQDMTTAMKEQNKFELSVLRLLKSAVQMEKISLKREMSDADVLNVIKRQVKQRKDSLEEFKKYNKIDEVDKLTKEIECLKKYLPAELSDEEIDKKLAEVFDELKPEGMKDMGRVMKEVVTRLGAAVDMTIVSQKVREKLK